MAGYGVKMAMKMGISRGVFSNEAGLGSSVMAHAASDVSCPQIQGMWGMAEVFIDTIVVCTITALVILTSGVYDPQRYISNIADGVENIDGTTLTGKCLLQQYFQMGTNFLPSPLRCLRLRPSSAGHILESGQQHIFLENMQFFPYKLIYILLLLPGSVLAPKLVWELSDTFNGLMAIPNLTALILLHGEVIHMAKEYKRNRK